MVEHAIAARQVRYRLEQFARVLLVHFAIGTDHLRGHVSGLFHSTSFRSWRKQQTNTKLKSKHPAHNATLPLYPFLTNSVLHNDNFRNFHKPKETSTRQLNLN